MTPNPLMDLSFRDIAATSYLLRDRVLTTQCVRSQLTNYLKCKNLYLKLEFKQNGGCYKTRGAFNVLMTMPREERKRGIVTASQGNHGIALSYAGRKLSVPITVVFPRFASASKVQICRKFGANVLVDGEDLNESQAIANDLANKENARFINIYSNCAITVGNATAGIEMAQQVPKMDFCIIPYTEEKAILRGMQVAIRKMCPCCKIYLVRNSSKNLTRSASDDDTLMDNIIEVSEDEILTAFLLLVEVEKVLVEPSSAMAVAALTSKRYPEFQDKNVVCYLSSGNVDLAAMTKLLANLTPTNTVTFSVSILDEVGSLEKLCAEIAKCNVSVADIVFPRTNNNNKMILFCETTGPEHSKTFIKTMLTVYRDFQVIPLRAAIKSQGSRERHSHGELNEHDDNNMNKRHIRGEYNGQDENNMNKRHIRSEYNDQDENNMNKRNRSTEFSKYTGDKRCECGLKGGRREVSSSKGYQAKPANKAPIPRSDHETTRRDHSRSKMSQYSTAKRSKIPDSSSFHPHTDPSYEHTHDAGMRKTDRSDELDSREKYGKRAKNRSQEYSSHNGNDSRDAMYGGKGDDSGPIVGEFEQMDHLKIYTEDRYDDCISPLGSLRVEEKRSVSKTVGRFDVGEKTRFGTIDKIVESTTISRHEPIMRHPFMYQRPPLLPANKPGESIRRGVENGKVGGDVNRDSLGPNENENDVGYSMSCDDDDDDMNDEPELKSPMEPKLASKRPFMKSGESVRRGKETSAVSDSKKQRVSKQPITDRNVDYPLYCECTDELYREENESEYKSSMRPQSSSKRQINKSGDSITRRPGSSVTPGGRSARSPKESTKDYSRSCDEFYNDTKHSAPLKPKTSSKRQISKSESLRRGPESGGFSAGRGARSSRDDTKDSQVDYSLSCDNVDDVYHNEDEPHSKIPYSEKSGDRIDKGRESRRKGLRSDCYCSNKPDSSDTLESFAAQGGSTPDPWVPMDTSDDLANCRRSTISVSEHNLCYSNQDSKQSPRLPSRLKKCRIDSCPFIDRHDTGKRSPTPERAGDLYCECGKKIAGCTRQTCPAYKGKFNKDTQVSKDSCVSGELRNMSKDLQKGVKSSENQGSKDMTALSGSSSACSISTKSTISDNCIPKNSSESNRLDAGADEMHFLLHDGDYEECHCSKTSVSPVPCRLSLTKRQSILDKIAAFATKSVREKTSFSDFEASLPNAMDFI